MSEFVWEVASDGLRVYLACMYADERRGVAYGGESGISQSKEVAQYEVSHIGPDPKDKCCVRTGVLGQGVSVQKQTACHSKVCVTAVTRLRCA